MARKKKDTVADVVSIPVLTEPEPISTEIKAVEPPVIETELAVDVPAMEPSSTPKRRKKSDGKTRKKVYSIRLYSVPSADIEAETAEEAFELYKQRFGILATDHRPSIREVEVAVDDE